MPLRTGAPDGDVGTIGSGDSDTTLTDVFETQDTPDAVFVVDTLIIDYIDGSTSTVVEIHDADTTTAAGSLDADSLRFKKKLTGGEFDVMTGITLRDFEFDVIADPDGSQDADVVVHVGGHYVTHNQGP